MGATTPAGIKCLLRAPSGICRRAAVDRSHLLRRIGPAERIVRGWGSLDGPADEWATTSTDTALVPAGVSNNLDTTTPED